MTSKAGRRVRKQIPEPVIPEEPPLDVQCLCPKCSTRFNPEEIRGMYLNRLCPSCGASLSEAVYDERAREICESLDEVEARLLIEKKEAEKWKERRNGKLFAWVAPLKRYADRKLRAIEETLSDIRADKLDSWRDLGALALSRYYAGEWYLRTGFPLERTVIDPFKLVPEYSAAGVWRLPAGYGDVAGMTAEFEVFQKVLEKVRDVSSPLYQAQLLPNLYFPREPSNRGERALWDQVDLIVAMRQAAFVLEVKSRKGASVTAFKPFEAVGINGAEKTAALTQNSRHAVAFADICPKYPFESVYEQLVFTRLDSFETDEAGFIDNVNVSVAECESYCMAHASGCDARSFVDAIEAECEKLPPIMDQQQLDRLGETLVTTYGDLNQKRGRLHVQRIKNMR